MFLPFAFSLGEGVIYLVQYCHHLNLVCYLSFQYVFQGMCVLSSYSFSSYLGNGIALLLKDLAWQLFFLGAIVPVAAQSFIGQIEFDALIMSALS